MAEPISQILEELLSCSRCFHQSAFRSASLNKSSTAAVFPRGPVKLVAVLTSYTAENLSFCIREYPIVKFHLPIKWHILAESSSNGSCRNTFALISSELSAHQMGLTASAEVASLRNLHTEARPPIIIAVFGFTYLVFQQHGSPWG